MTLGYVPPIISSTCIDWSFRCYRVHTWGLESYNFLWRNWSNHEAV